MNKIEKFIVSNQREKAELCYKSPIEILENVARVQQKALEDNAWQVVLSYGINVNKEELIKALQYDRAQYQKGYEDRDKEIVRCKDCKYRNDEKIANWLWCRLVLTRDDDYCNYGERKE